MYSSPTTPTGAKLRLASNTYTSVFAIGLPIGIVPFTDVTRDTVDHTVVSVGPYMFHNSRHRVSSFSPKSGGNDSPPHRIFSFGDPPQPASIRPRQVAGVACITVHFDSSIRSISCAGSCVSSRLAITTLPPLINGKYSSNPATSNDSVVTANSVSLASKPGSRCIDRRKFTRATCSIATPFGFPVDPDVYSTYAKL